MPTLLHVHHSLLISITFADKTSEACSFYSLHLSAPHLFKCTHNPLFSWAESWRNAPEKSAFSQFGLSGSALPPVTATVGYDVKWSSELNSRSYVCLSAPKRAPKHTQVVRRSSTPISLALLQRGVKEESTL